MTALRLNDLRQHSDILRLRNGKSLTVRFVEPRDAEALQHYFRSLSVRSRYNRFLGAVSELPPTELDHFIHAGEDDRFSVIAVMMIDGFETIVGEARYGFEAETGQFRVRPVDRRPLAGPGHRFGVAAKSANAAPPRSAPQRLFGDTLRSNDVMIGLARKSGFAFMPQPRRLEAGALRKTYRRRAAGYSLRKLAARGAADRASGSGLISFPLNTAFRFSINACTASR